MFASQMLITIFATSVALCEAGLAMIRVNPIAAVGQVRTVLTLLYFGDSGCGIEKITGTARTAKRHSLLYLRRRMQDKVRREGQLTRALQVEFERVERAILAIGF